MKKLFCQSMNSDLGTMVNNIAILAFRVILSLELILAHGVKKLGVNGMQAEMIPNPLGLPQAFNSMFALAANILFPLFIIAGLFTRLATLPILAVTLTGYFVVHWNGSLLEKDTPLMYSLCFLFVLLTGAGRYSLDSRLTGVKQKK